MSDKKTLSIINFSGKVYKNVGRGTTLGFKTANIKIKSNLPEGVFISKIKLQNVFYNALVFIGKPLTFNEKDKRAEVYILDFDSDIYGVYVDVSLIVKIRENQKFEDKEKLIDQIKNDIKTAREFFKN